MALFGAMNTNWLWSVDIPPDIPPQVFNAREEVTSGFQVILFWVELVGGGPRGSSTICISASGSSSSHGVLLTFPSLFTFPPCDRFPRTFVQLLSSASSFVLALQNTFLVMYSTLVSFSLSFVACELRGFPGQASTTSTALQLYRLDHQTLPPTHLPLTLAVS